MAAHTHVAVGYNVQVAVDAKHKLIVEQQVTNQVVDMGLLAQTAEPAKEVLGVGRIAVVAHRGYFKIEDIEACEKAGIDPYVPRPPRGPSVRLENEAVLDRMQARIVQRPDILDQRRETVEHPFGTIKQWMNQGAFPMRGLEKVRAEFSLTALAYNLRRVLNIVAFPDLIAALQA